LGHLVYRASHRPWVNSAPASPEEKSSFTGVRHQLRPTVGQPIVQGPLGWYSVRNHPLFRALSEHTNRAPSRVKIVTVDQHEFADTDAGGVQEFAYRTITRGNRIAVISGHCC